MRGQLFLSYLQFESVQNYLTNLFKQNYVNHVINLFQEFFKFGNLTNLLKSITWKNVIHEIVQFSDNYSFCSVSHHPLQKKKSTVLPVFKVHVASHLVSSRSIIFSFPQLSSLSSYSTLFYPCILFISMLNLDKVNWSQSIGKKFVFHRISGE